MQNRARDSTSLSRRYLSKRLRNKLTAGRTKRGRKQERRDRNHSIKDQTHVFGCMAIVTDLHNRLERGSQKTQETIEFI